jgi:hypothetical protein
MDSETKIRDVLTKLIVKLVELALRALGLTDEQTPVYISVTAVWKIEIWWELATTEAIKTTRLSAEASATLRTALGQLAERLEQVVATGGDWSQIRSEVEKFRDQWSGWARRVATTESTRLASELALDSEAARTPGAKKEWVTSHDEKVRGSHRIADGQRVPLEGVFQVGNGSLRYPGDPLGDPEEVVNCRCYLRIAKGGQ